MTFRALALATSTAVVCATSSFAGSLDYNFSFSEIVDIENDATETLSVLGNLSFDDAYFSSVGTGVTGVLPDLVEVIASSIGGLGRYDTETDSSQNGFDFDADRNIVGADYTVVGVDENNAGYMLDFGLELSTTGQRRSRHVLSCMDLYSGQDAASICANNTLSRRTEIVGVSVNYTRIGEKVEDEQLPAVPVPAGFPLLLGGLAGFAFLGRRKAS